MSIEVLIGVGGLAVAIISGLGSALATMRTKDRERAREKAEEAQRVEQAEKLAADAVAQHTATAAKMSELIGKLHNLVEDVDQLTRLVYERDRWARKIESMARGNREALRLHAQVLRQLASSAGIPDTVLGEITAPIDVPR